MMTCLGFVQITFKAFAFYACLKCATERIAQNYKLQYRSILAFAYILSTIEMYQRAGNYIWKHLQHTNVSTPTFSKLF